MKFDFDKKPGKLLNTKEYEEVVPIISIIFPIINNDKMNINSIKNKFLKTGGKDNKICFYLFFLREKSCSRMIRNL